MKNFLKFKKELKKTLKTAWYCIKYALPGNRLRIINLTKEIQCLHKNIISYCKITNREDLISKYDNILIKSIGITDLISIKKDLIKDYIVILQEDLNKEG